MFIVKDCTRNPPYILYDDGTQGILKYGEVVSRSKAPISLQPESFVGLTLKQAKMKLGIKN